MTEEIISQDPFDIPPPPKVEPVDPDNIPAFLREARQWIVWKYSWNGAEKKYNKRPFAIGPDGDWRVAKREDRSNFADMNLAEALELFEAHKSFLTGVGFVVSGKSNIWAFDADNCTDPEFGIAAHLDSDVSEFMSEANCYMEYSPSWAGVRGFGLMPDSGVLPLVASFQRKANGEKGCGREMYFPHSTKTHFVTVTGRVIPEKTREAVPADPEFLVKWHNTWAGARGSEFDVDTAGMSPPVVDGVRVLSVDEGGLSQADLDVLYSGSLDTGGKDRSSYLQGLSNRVYLAGLSREEGWSVLAGCALAGELCSGKSDGLEWLWRYTAAKAWAECGRRSAAEEFEVVSEDIASEVVRVVSWADSAVDIGGGLASGSTTLPDPRPILFGGFYSRRECSLTFGYGGGGKSILGMVESIAMCLDAGFLGERPMEPDLKVLYVNLDDKIDELTRRTWAICHAFNINPQDLSGRFYCIGSDSKGIDTRFLDISPTGVSVNQPAWNGLKTAIDQLGVDVVVLDPLANFSEGNESNQDMLAIASSASNLAIATNTSVHLVHHTRKASSGSTGGVTRAVDIDDARGGGALTGRVRHVRSVRKLTPEEAEKLGLTPDRAGYYIRVDSGLKANYTPIQYADMYELLSIDLNNAKDRRGSDHVGVPTPFNPVVSAHDVMALWQEIEARAPDDLLPASRKGGAANVWKGIAVKIGMPYASLSETVDGWIGGGYLAPETYWNKNRDKKQGLKCIQTPPEVFTDPSEF